MALFPHPDPKSLAVEAMKLAFAASSPMGMGFLHFKPGPLPAEIAKGMRDEVEKYGVIRADYVQGRMMKLNLRVVPNAVEYNDRPLSLDYESWCGRYPTTLSLLEAAALTLAPTPATA